MTSRRSFLALLAGALAVKPEELLSQEPPAADVKEFLGDSYLNLGFGDYQAQAFLTPPAVLVDPNWYRNWTIAENIVARSADLFSGRGGHLSAAVLADFVSCEMSSSRPHFADGLARDFLARPFTGARDTETDSGENRFRA